MSWLDVLAVAVVCVTGLLGWIAYLALAYESDREGR